MITTGGQITEFPLSTGSFPQRIVVGSDGALWFTDNRASEIGRISTDGTYTEYAAPTGPIGITVGPDGGLWFVAFGANEIARMDMAGQVTNEYPIPTLNSAPFQITVGPDAALWFSQDNANKLGRLQPPGTAARGLTSPVGPGSSASFSVSLYSSKLGQGYVYFGSGPGCQGLVEVATRDLRPGTASHTVVVTGNDLPGTVGNIGIQPGTTYYYEVVTVTSSSVEVDDNGGKCYSVTSPKT